MDNELKFEYNDPHDRMLAIRKIYAENTPEAALEILEMLGLPAIHSV